MTKARLHQLVEELPESENHAAARYLEFLRDRGREEAAPSGNGQSTETYEERRARIYALAGKYKNVLSSTDEFCRRKQEEIDLEEAKWERNRSQPKE